MYKLSVQINQRSEQEIDSNILMNMIYMILYCCSISRTEKVVIFAKC